MEHGLMFCRHYTRVLVVIAMSSNLRIRMQISQKIMMQIVLSHRTNIMTTKICR